MNHFHGLNRRSLLLVATFVASFCWADSDQEMKRVQKIIIGTKQWGVHGAGYNLKSIQQMKKEILPSDIPVLIKIYTLPKSKVSKTGVMFAFASLCEHGARAVSRYFEEGIIQNVDASDSLNLIVDSELCDSQAKNTAKNMISNVSQRSQERSVLIKKKYDEKVEKDDLLQKKRIEKLMPTPGKI